MSGTDPPGKSLTGLQLGKDKALDAIGARDFKKEKQTRPSHTGKPTNTSSNGILTLLDNVDLVQRRRTTPNFYRPSFIGAARCINAMETRIYDSQRSMTRIWETYDPFIMRYALSLAWHWRTVEVLFSTGQLMAINYDLHSSYTRFRSEVLLSDIFIPGPLVPFFQANCALKSQFPGYNEIYPRYDYAFQLTAARGYLMSDDDVCYAPTPIGLACQFWSTIAPADGQQRPTRNVDGYVAAGNPASVWAHNGANNMLRFASVHPLLPLRTPMSPRPYRINLRRNVADVLDTLPPQYPLADLAGNANDLDWISALLLDDIPRARIMIKKLEIYSNFWTSKATLGSIPIYGSKAPLVQTSDGTAAPANRNVIALAANQGHTVQEIFADSIADSDKICAPDSKLGIITLINFQRTDNYGPNNNPSVDGPIWQRLDQTRSIGRNFDKIYETYITSAFVAKPQISKT